MDGRTNGRTDGPTDWPTKRGVESRSTRLKILFILINSDFIYDFIKIFLLSCLWCELSRIKFTNNKLISMFFDFSISQIWTTSNHFFFCSLALKKNLFIFLNWLMFLVACKATLQPALSVRGSVGRQDGRSLLDFFLFLRYLASLFLPKCSSDIKYGPCPPVLDLGVSSLVLSWIDG